MNMRVDEPRRQNERSPIHNLRIRYVEAEPHSVNLFALYEDIPPEVTIIRVH